MFTACPPQKQTGLTNLQSLNLTHFPLASMYPPLIRRKRESSMLGSWVPACAGTSGTHNRINWKALARRSFRRKQIMLLEKLDQVAVEQPRLLDLTGVAGAVKDFHFAAGNARLQRGGARMRVVFAAGQNDHRTADA